MQAEWKVFEGQPNRLGGQLGQPRITLNPRGCIYLNKKAVDGMGRPKAVELMYDPARRLIGIRATDPTRRSAFRLVRHGKDSRRIAAGAFCRHFGIRVTRTVLFDRPDLRAGLGSLVLHSHVVHGVDRKRRIDRRAFLTSFFLWVLAERHASVSVGPQPKAYFG